MTMHAYLLHAETADDDTRSRAGAALGSRKSAAKAKAVRVNGQLGGRPIALGWLGLKGQLDETPRIQVYWSRSYGGIVFRRPDGQREFWTEGACGSPEEALKLMAAWFLPRHPTMVWLPFWGTKHTWRYSRQSQRRKMPWRERARLKAEGKLP